MTKQQKTALNMAKIIRIQNVLMIGKLTKVL
ncbi:Rop family plasmid primer RNA-binding protein, partial [Klebsiella pneumoniae]